MLDLGDVGFTEVERGNLRESIEAYGKGDLLVALDKYPSVAALTSENEIVFHAALLLSVGQAEKAEQTLSSLFAGDHSAHAKRLASAILKLIVAIKRERVERLNRPKQVYDAILEHYKDANLFDDHSLKTSKPAKDAAAAISSALLYTPPVYKITANRSPRPETYEIVCQQDVVGSLISAGGRRKCIIVCGQTRDDETQILFKVLEYKTKHNVTLPGLLAFKDEQELVPIHTSRIPDMTDKLKGQLQAGVSNLTVRIQGAIGQSPAPAVQSAAPQ